MNRLLLSRSSALKLASFQLPRMFSSNAALRHKAVIFDMGGVLVESPVQTFRAYEERHRIPHNSLASLVFEGENSGAFVTLNFEQFCSPCLEDIGAEASVCTCTLVCTSNCANLFKLYMQWTRKSMYLKCKHEEE